jgi:predicted transglutaminase-like cysteine proteinase
VKKQQKEQDVRFFRAVSDRLKPQRLGDLLVNAQIISAAQLERALSEQKATKAPLGQILVRQGAASALHIYQKLAEQWCLKTATAAVTLVMSFSSVSTARADSQNNQGDLTFVSATMGLPSQGMVKQQRLFGSAEKKSDDLSAFKKWNTMFDRFEDQLKAQQDNKKVTAWKNKLASLKTKSEFEKIQAVNTYLNSIEYITDARNFKQNDFWQTPIEFMKRGGDCEDYAIAKYASLRSLGFSNEQLRVAIVHDEIKNIPHAILVVYTADGTYILDNQDKRVRKMEDVSRYRPIYSISRQGWWLHKPAQV